VTLTDWANQLAVPLLKGGHRTVPSPSEWIDRKSLRAAARSRSARSVSSWRSIGLAECLSAHETAPSAGIVANSKGGSRMLRYGQSPSFWCGGVWMCLRLISRVDAAVNDGAGSAVT
jgi:hypothetical protein